ncbi:hypothetical protein MSZK_40270 [Mycobacterium sp. shizuoka-1]|nr:hypothetical protein MSZK_40270 [Mycobacterium sp. shizuoka-1]
MGALDVNQFGIGEIDDVRHQICGGFADHHPAGRGDRLHPLREPHLFTDRGVTCWARRDVTGDHLARVQADPQLKRQPVDPLDLGGQLPRLLLHVQRRQAGAQRMVFEGRGCTEDRHDAVAGEFVDGSAVAGHHRGGPQDQAGHDLSQPLGPQRRGDVHGPHHIGEQHRDLLVLGRQIGVDQWCTARVAESCAGARVGAA